MSNFGCDSTATTEENTGDSPRYSVGTFPAGGGTLTDVRMFLSGYSGGATFRVGIYQGGTASDPTGAALIYDSGQFSYNVNPPKVWKGLVADFAKTPSGSLAGSAFTWFVIKVNDGGIGLSNAARLDLSAGSAKDGALNNTSSVAFPSTYPTTSVLNGAEAMMMYLVYTPASSSVDPGVVFGSASVLGSPFFSFG